MVQFLWPHISPILIANVSHLSFSHFHRFFQGPWLKWWIYVFCNIVMLRLMYYGFQLPCNITGSSRRQLYKNNLIKSLLFEWLLRVVCTFITAIGLQFALTLQLTLCRVSKYFLIYNSPARRETDEINLGQHGNIARMCLPLITLPLDLPTSPWSQRYRMVHSIVFF
jgi:hypothetical protein